jgi:hypothetical protein
LVECYKTIGTPLDEALGYQEAWREAQLIGFKLLEDEIGTEKAVEWYSKTWTLLSEKAFDKISMDLGIKQIDLPAFIKMVKIWAQQIGCVFEIAEATKERAIGRTVRCWEAEVGEKMLGKEKSMELHHKTEPTCNRAIMEAMLKKFNIPASFEFKQQICTGGKYCEYAFQLNRKLST